MPQLTSAIHQTGPRIAHRCGPRDTHCGYRPAASSRAVSPERSAAARTAQFSGVCDDCRRRARTVLIVDDHPSFRSSARAILEAEGFSVVGEAADGRSALETAEALHPDVVLLDVQLPDMTGFEVCTALLTANGSAPAVVLVSSRDASDYGALIAACGASGFVPKAELYRHRRRRSAFVRALRFALAGGGRTGRNRDRYGPHLLEQPRVESLAHHAVRPQRGSDVRRRRAGGALAPARERDRFLARRHRLPLVRRRPRGVEPELGVDGRVLHQQPGFRRVRRADPRVPGRNALPARQMARGSRRSRLQSAPTRSRRSSITHPPSSCDDCPSSAIAIADLPGLKNAVSVVGTVIVAIVLIAVVAVLVQRWRRSSAAQKRLLPAGLRLLRHLRGCCSSSPCSRTGSTRRRTRRSGSSSSSRSWRYHSRSWPACCGVASTEPALARMLLSLEAGAPLRDTLAEALHDPSLEIVYWLDGPVAVGRRGRTPSRGTGGRPRLDRSRRSRNTAVVSRLSFTTRCSTTSRSSSTRSPRPLH